jgi:hypothetical protein
MNLDDYGIAVGKPADLLVLDCREQLLSHRRAGSPAHRASKPDANPSRPPVPASARPSASEQSRQHHPVQSFGSWRSVGLAGVRRHEQAWSMPKPLACIRLHIRTKFSQARDWSRSATGHWPASRTIFYFRKETTMDGIVDLSVVYQFRGEARQSAICGLTEIGYISRVQRAVYAQVEG